MLHKFHSKITLLITAVVIIFTACKKDPFSEKDALAAQQSLLQTQMSFQVQIAQINAAASRSHDSALIAIQVLQNSGASALAVLQAQQQMAYLMQQYQNQIAMYKMQDSLARATSKFNDSLTAARNSQNTLNALKANYVVRVNDFVTGQPVASANVSVFSYNVNAIVSATTDANGIANFSQIIVDPNAYFYISKVNYSTAFTRASNISNGASVALWNSGTAQNTVQGQIVADLDLTNGDAVEGVSGQLVTFSLTYTYNGVSQTVQFPVITDANGNYSAKLPDAPNGLNYIATTQQQITVNQKMFVHLVGGQNIQTTLPHIDSIPTTLSISNSYGSIFNFNNVNYLTPNYGGFPIQAQMAYYYSMPNDVNGKQVWAGTTTPVFNGTSYGGFYPNFFTTAFATGNTNPLLIQDTINYASAISIVGLDNGVGQLYTNSFNDPNFTYKPSGGTAPSAVPVTLVDLTGGNIVKNAPNLIAKIISANGRINYVSNADTTYTPSGSSSPITQALPGSGGKLAIRSATNRLIDKNVFGVRTSAFANAALSSNAVTIFGISGGVTKTFNFDYSSLVSRANVAY